MMERMGMTGTRVGNRAAAARANERREPAVHRSTLAYRALLVFSFLYFVRPEDLIPWLRFVPVSKISGGIALVALFAGFLGGRLKTKVPLELKVLVLLFAHLVLTIPFAHWRGGSFDVVMRQFSKSVLVALLVGLVVQSLGELRKLLFVQAAAVAVMTLVSLVIHPGDSVRLQGLLGGIFENPNDLAINIAINWPLVVVFLLAARGILKKGLWLIALAGMLYAVVVTYSRSGSIAMMVCFLVCVWEFAIRGKRFPLLVATGMVVVVGGAVMLATPHYMTRMKSTFEGNIQGSGDQGSLNARQELLRRSIQLTLEHPIFGVGPGNFPVVTETWHVTHNTYTELSSEAGIPALVLFLLILFLAFRNVSRIRKTSGYAASPEIRLYTSAMWASLAAYLVGAAFSSTEYTLFPYFMLAYTSVLYRIANSYAPESPAPAGKEARRGSWRNRLPANSNRATPELAGRR